MLQIDHVPPVSDSDESVIRERWATMDKVLSRLAARGIVVPQNPPPFPIPEVTTTLVATDNVEFLKVNARYLAWLNYVLPHVALCEGVVLEVKNQKSHLEAMYRDKAREFNEGKPRREQKSTQEIDDDIALDPLYIELTQRGQEMSQELKFLNSQCEILERTLRVISRHVEVKKVDVEMNRIGANLPQRRARPQLGGYGDD